MVPWHVVGAQMLFPMVMEHISLLCTIIIKSQTTPDYNIQKKYRPPFSDFRSSLSPSSTEWCSSHPNLLQAGAVTLSMERSAWRNAWVIGQKRRPQALQLQDESPWTRVLL